MKQLKIIILENRAIKYVLERVSSKQNQAFILIARKKDNSSWVLVQLFKPQWHKYTCLVNFHCNHSLRNYSRIGLHKAVAQLQLV